MSELPVELSAEAAPAGSPWLALALAVIAAASAVLVAAVPKWIERRREPDVAPNPDPPARAVSALTIVQDAMDDLQRRLDERERELAERDRKIAERDRELAEARRRIAELEAQLHV